MNVEQVYSLDLCKCWDIDSCYLTCLNNVSGFRPIYCVFMCFMSKACIAQQEIEGQRGVMH